MQKYHIIYYDIETGLDYSSDILDASSFQNAAHVASLNLERFNIIENDSQLEIRSIQLIKEDKK